MARPLSAVIIVIVALSLLYPALQAATPRVIRLPLYYGRPPDTLAAAPSIDTLGLSWKKTSLTVQIVQASFVPSTQYYTAVENAFSAWDQALANFGATYGYSYLSQFSFAVSLVSAASTGYDITVEFTSATAAAGGEIGEALISYVGGTILSVKITLYLYVSGVGTLTPTDVYNIALHEIGHALGLNHAAQAYTVNGEEVMYPYYNFPGTAMSPSTLDAYALAKVYAWLSTGVYTTVPAQTVYLPSTIPYEEISVSVAPVLPVYKVTVISPVNVVVGAGLYPQGATVTLRVTKTVVDLGNGTRLVFAGWVGTVNSTSPTITVTVNGDITERVVWKKEYRVELTWSFGVTCGKPGWYEPGTKITFRVAKTVYVFSNGTRLVFAGWSGDVKSSSTSITVTVNGPLRITPVWRRQYLVEVETRYANANITKAWVDAGGKIAVKLDHEVVNLGNGTRLVHVGWTGDVESNGRVLVISVTRPVRVEPVWKKQYLVQVETQGLVGANINSSWVDAGAKITIYLENETVSLGNGTRLVHVGWTGDVKTSNLTLTVEVKKPLHVKPVWRREYLLKASSPYPVLNVRSGWYAQNKTLHIEPLKTVIDHGNGTRHVFAGWLVDGKLVRNETLTLHMDGPHAVKAVWKTQYRVSLTFSDAQGCRLNFTAVLEADGETVTLTTANSSGVWLGKGTWKITLLNYTSPEVISSPGSLILGRKKVLVTETCTGDCGTVEVEKPGSRRVTLNIYNVTVTVRDQLGLPAPGLTVEIGGRRYTSDLDGFLVQRLIHGGVHKATIYFAGVKVGTAKVTVNGNGKVTVKADLPVYPAAGLAALAAVVAVARRLALK